MGDRQIWYYIKEGVRSIFTHGLMSFAAVCMTVACLLIMGSFSLIAVNAGNILQDLEDENEFLAYVDESLSQNEARALQDEIEAIPNVSSVTFVTKEQALQDFIAQQETAELFENTSAETLRDRYRIHVEDIEQLQETADQVKQVNGIADVEASLEIADGFVMVRNVATAIAVILIVMLVVISVFIIANTIKLSTFTRREEIAIMKMCGATNAFVRWPFVFEGLILGLVGAVAAFFLQWGIYVLVGSAISGSDTISLITVLPFQPMALRVLGVFVLTGFVIGAGGSVLAIRKFLQV